ncbi:PIG-L family deacetylase [Pararhodonellum marinum]|uniref:PIG-L family deacetylase n=1 Tax=Pararhodonellum marinum TaxID=2755358 RepID=UPI00188E2AD6|nr:PIG-L family deacetylase [Pararhodonellum marinum]
MRIIQCILIIAIFFGSFGLSAQTLSSSEIYHQLLRLKETKRILYVAAHPDDENTRLIAYLANREHAQVAYLSMTRGDGGQNLIGKELGIELGMIRTQELLRARELDGGIQYFSRALDFGYSKNPPETLNNWDEEKLLSDVVWIIRKFQPDIIITRFNTIPGTTHGHHTTSAILAGKAFKMSNDPNVFPDQLEHVQPWQAKRIFWNAYSWGGNYEPEPGKLFYNFPVGEFNPILGTSYSQIAADSRTMHKSQGFGATAQTGESNDFVELVDGANFRNDPFEGVANKWEELEGGKAIEQQIQVAIDNYDFRNPSAQVEQLLAIKKSLDRLKTDLNWVREKQQLIREITNYTLGIKTEFLSKKELAYPGEEVSASLVFNNPSKISVKLIEFTILDKRIPISETVVNNQPFRKEVKIVLPETYPVSQPYWLDNPVKEQLFDIEDQTLIGKAFNQPALTGLLSYEMSGELYTKEVPLVYKYNDQVDGEIKQPFTLIPEVNLSLDKNNLYVLDGIPQVLRVDVRFQNGEKEGEIILNGLPESKYKTIRKENQLDKKLISFWIEIEGLSEREKQEVEVQYVTPSGKVFNQGMKRILYKHIPNLTYFPSSTFNLLSLNKPISSQKIGYVNGAGDDIPSLLSNMGYEVTLLENGDWSQSKLATYQTIIVGIRAFNVNQQLADQVGNLMKYVEDGGNLIVQYNTSSPLLTRNLGPYPFELSRNRVAVEDSPVIMDKTNKVLQTPYQIESRDFEGWVQERGLYFPDQWDNAYQTPLTLQDPDEPSTKGGLLLAEYGKGTYAYSGISWFRQLPAGVPGATKIFINLIERAGAKR